MGGNNPRDDEEGSSEPIIPDVLDRNDDNELTIDATEARPARETEGSHQRDVDNRQTPFENSQPNQNSDWGRTDHQSANQYGPGHQQTDQGTSGTKGIRGNMRFCEHCGSEISMEAEICPDCGVRLEANEKNPGIAALLSAIWSGAGQIYNGDIAKGVIIMAVQAFNVVLMFALIGLITFPIVWVYSIYDAYKTAEKR